MVEIPPDVVVPERMNFQPVALDKMTDVLILPAGRPVVVEHKTSAVVEDAFLGRVRLPQRVLEHRDRTAVVVPHNIDLLDRIHLALLSSFVPLQIVVSLHAPCRPPTFLESCTESSYTCNSSSTKESTAK